MPEPSITRSAGPARETSLSTTSGSVVTAPTTPQINIIADSPVTERRSAESYHSAKDSLPGDTPKASIDRDIRIECEDIPEEDHTVVSEHAATCTAGNATKEIFEDAQEVHSANSEKGKNDENTAALPAAAAAEAAAEATTVIGDDSEEKNSVRSAGRIVEEETTTPATDQKVPDSSDEDIGKLRASETKTPGSPSKLDKNRPPTPLLMAIEDDIDPAQVARDLRAGLYDHNVGVSQVLAGTHPYAEKVCQEYLRLMECCSKPIDEALRTFLESFQLNGETGEKTRIIERFSNFYWEENDGKLPQNLQLSKDAVFALCVSLVLLNTDLHNRRVEKKMTMKQFINNNRGLNDGKDFPKQLLQNLYLNIRKREIKMPMGDSRPTSIGTSGVGIAPYGKPRTFSNDNLSVNIMDSTFGAPRRKSLKHRSLFHPRQGGNFVADNGDGNGNGTSASIRDDQSETASRLTTTSNRSSFFSLGRKSKSVSMVNLSNTDSQELLGPLSANQVPPHPDFLLLFKEDILNRKQVMDGHRRASVRNWKTFYMVLQGPYLYHYRHKTRKSAPLSRIGVFHALATDSSYSKKGHVFELRLASGTTYLFQARSLPQKETWVRMINTAAAIFSAPPLSASVSSNKATFLAPLLPQSTTRMSKEEQLVQHKARLTEYQADLEQVLRQLTALHTVSGSVRAVGPGANSAGLPQAYTTGGIGVERSSSMRPTPTELASVRPGGGIGKAKDTATATSSGPGTPQSHGPQDSSGKSSGASTPSTRASMPTKRDSEGSLTTREGGKAVNASVVSSSGSAVSGGVPASLNRGESLHYLTEKETWLRNQIIRLTIYRAHLMQLIVNEESGEMDLDLLKRLNQQTSPLESVREESRTQISGSGMPTGSTEKITASAPNGKQKADEVSADPDLEPAATVI
eukprot:Clim_evm13s60 gene=Clim_evmTU13s60